MPRPLSVNPADQSESCEVVCISAVMMACRDRKHRIRNSEAGSGCVCELKPSTVLGGLSASGWKLLGNLLFCEFFFYHGCCTNACSCIHIVIWKPTVRRCEHQCTDSSTNSKSQRKKEPTVMEEGNLLWLKSNISCLVSSALLNLIETYCFTFKAATYLTLIWEHFKQVIIMMICSKNIH